MMSPIYLLKVPKSTSSLHQTLVPKRIPPQKLPKWSNQFRLLRKRKQTIRNQNQRSQRESHHVFLSEYQSECKKKYLLKRKLSKRKLLHPQHGPGQLADRQLEKAKHDCQMAFFTSILIQGVRSKIWPFVNNPISVSISGQLRSFICCSSAWIMWHGYIYGFSSRNFLKLFILTVLQCILPVSF